MEGQLGGDALTRNFEPMYADSYKCIHSEGSPCRICH